MSVYFSFNGISFKYQQNTYYIVDKNQDVHA